MSKTTLKVGVIFCVIWSIFAGVVSAAQYQQCLIGTNCSLGEFLYDDNYQPISVGTTCTLTSRYPNGDLLVNSATMNVTADGWYSYNVGTSGLATGVYRGQMCCTTSGEYLCLDKSFEAVYSTGSNLASEVWTYPGRSLDSLTNLVAGIWSNSTRTLTSSNLGDGSSLATGANIANLSTQVSQVQTSLITIDTKVSDLQSSITAINTNTNNILAKWSTYSVTDIINYVDTVEAQLGNNSQTCSDNSVFGHIQCIIDKWGSESATTIYTAANNAYSTVTSLRSELNFNGKSTTAYDEVMAIKSYVDTIETSIGTTSDASSVASVFGRLKQIKEAVDDIDNTTLDLTDLMNKWGSYSAADLYAKTVEIGATVAALNTVSNTSNITNITQTSDVTDIKNRLIALKALLEVNRLQLESISNKPIIHSWLEEGSIIFKSLITNPSSLATQTADYLYILPTEVKTEHIIKKSEEIDLSYDSTKQSLVASGQFKLKPRETLTIEIEVKDIWTISDDQLASLRRQADDLFSPLKNTSYFAQGATLHSSILTSLEKITNLQKESTTPEDKLKTYSDTKIELASVNRQIDSLKTLVTSAGSIGTLSGFIGGVQTIAVWGIIVVLVAGFVFLTLYIRSSLGNSSQRSPPPPPPTSTISKRRQRPYINQFLFAAALGLSSGASSTFTAYYFTRTQPNKQPQVLSATTSSEPSPTPTPTIEPTQTPLPTPTAISEDISDITVELPSVTPTPTVTVPVGGQQQPTPNSPSLFTASIISPSIINIREQPGREFPVIGQLSPGTTVNVTKTLTTSTGEKWYQLITNSQIGWILSNLTQSNQLNIANTQPVSSVNVVVPAHDSVYIYSKPSFESPVTYKLSTTRVAEILVETKRWVKVLFSQLNIEGWVSQDFIQKISQ